MADLVERAGENPKAAYEPSDWRLAPIGWLFIGTLALLVISTLVLFLAYPNTLSDTSRRLDTPMPAPRLQVHPGRDLARFRADENRKLDTYYWIDKQKGVVHIPIAAAMKNLARDGIPGFGAPSP